MRAKRLYSLVNLFSVFDASLYATLKFMNITMLSEESDKTLRGSDWSESSSGAFTRYAFFSRRGPLVNIVKIVPICWKRCQQTFYNELHACRFSRSSINLMHSTVNGPVFKPAVTLLKKVACVRSVIITINLYPCTNGNLSRSKECTFTGSYLFSSTVIASCETKRGDNNY